MSVDTPMSDFTYTILDPASAIVPTTVSPTTITATDGTCTVAFAF